MSTPQPNKNGDEIDFEIKPLVWAKFYKHFKRRWLFFPTILIELLRLVANNSLFITMGNIAEVLTEVPYIDGPDFIQNLQFVSKVFIIQIFIQLSVLLLNNYLGSLCIPYCDVDLSTLVFKSIMHQDLTFFDDKKTGLLLKRLTSDVPVVADGMTRRIDVIVSNAFLFISNAFYSFCKAPEIAGLMIPLIAVYTITTFVSHTQLMKIWPKENEEETEVTIKAEQALTSFRTIRSFDTEGREYRAFKNQLYRVHDVFCKAAFIIAVRESLQTVSTWSLAGIILYFGGKQIIKGNMKISTIVTLINTMGWGESFTGVLLQLSYLKKVNIAANRLVQITNHESAIKEEGIILESIKGEIEFKNVSFRYKSMEEYAIRNLSFKINAGETVAFVGESGCGKSTTLSLIQRFYDPDEGVITLDGIDLKEIHPASIHKFISLVPQDPVMFTMSAKGNIKYGDPQGSRKDVRKAAKIANAERFVENLPRGYNTKIQQTNLSGGQKQRICIARAVMMNAPVMLLDEATASLDTESENLVQKALASFKTGRTVVIVAHRLATVRHASRIMVMGHGTIIESGSHEELFLKGGAYTYLVNNQLH